MKLGNYNEIRKIDKKGRAWANGECKADDRAYVHQLESIEFKKGSEGVDYKIVYYIKLHGERGAHGTT